MINVLLLCHGRNHDKLDKYKDESKYKIITLNERVNSLYHFTGYIDPNPDYYGNITDTESMNDVIKNMKKDGNPHKYDIIECVNCPSDVYLSDKKLFEFIQTRNIESYNELIKKLTITLKNILKLLKRSESSYIYINSFILNFKDQSQMNTIKKNILQDVAEILKLDITYIHTGNKETIELRKSYDYKSSSNSKGGKLQKKKIKKNKK